MQGLRVVADVGGYIFDDGFTLDGVADGALGGGHFQELGIRRSIAYWAPHGGCVVGEIPVEADVHDGRQGLVDQFLQPDGGLGVLHLDDDADLGPLGGEGFHEGAVAEVAAAGGGACDGEAVGVAGLCEQLFGLGGIVGIGLDVGVVAEAAGGDDLAVELGAEAAGDGAPHAVEVDGVEHGLADAHVIQDFVAAVDVDADVHALHAVAGVEFKAVGGEAVDLVRGHVGGDVDLIAPEGGDAHCGFGHVAEGHRFDNGQVAGEIIPALEGDVAVALPGGELVGAGADGVFDVAVKADGFEVVGRERHVVGEEIGPAIDRFDQGELHGVVVDDFVGLVVVELAEGPGELLGIGVPEQLEALGKAGRGENFAVVELDAFFDDDTNGDVVDQLHGIEQDGVDGAGLFVEDGQGLVQQFGEDAGLQRWDGVAHERYGQGAHADDHLIGVAFFGHFVGGHVAGLGAAGVDGDTSGHDE